MCGIFVVTLFCFGGIRGCFCWVFFFVISKKEVEFRNLFCLSIDFGFCFKNFKEIFNYLLCESGGERRWGDGFFVNVRILELNVLGY